MADPKHIELLLEGVKAWNEERRIRPFEPDLSGAKIHEEMQKAGKLREDGVADLANVNFAGSNLRRCDLSGIVLDGSDFGGADLSNARLSGASLMYARLQGACLYRSNPWEARLYNADEYWQGGPPLLELPNTIENTADLLKVIFDVEQGHKSLVEATTLYYRGESKWGWDLEPSIFRRDSSTTEDLFQFESKMLVELASRRPDDFNSTKTALDQWVLAQHHGLRTRFLDVTKNPLVALFNTCRRNKKYDKQHGCLHVFAAPQFMIKTFSSDSISIVSNFARLSREEQEILLGSKNFPSLGYQPKHYNDTMTHLIRLIRQEKPYFAEEIDIRDFYRVYVVEPQQSVERIRTQSGAFLVSASHKRFEQPMVSKTTSNVPVYNHYKLRIPHKKKGDIMRELHSLNITGETLFPGLDSSASAITSRYTSITSERS